MTLACVTVCRSKRSCRRRAVIAAVHCNYALMRAERCCLRLLPPSTYPHPSPSPAPSLPPACFLHMNILMGSPIDGWLFVEFFPNSNSFIDVSSCVGFHVFRTLAVNFMKASLNARYLFILVIASAGEAKTKQRGPVSIGGRVIRRSGGFGKTRRSFGRNCERPASEANVPFGSALVISSVRLFLAPS